VFWIPQAHDHVLFNLAVMQIERNGPRPRCPTDFWEMALKIPSSTRGPTPVEHDEY